MKSVRQEDGSIMSGIKIEDQDQVELSEDGKTIEVLYNQDYSGNNYIEMMKNYDNRENNVRMQVR